MKFIICITVNETDLLAVAQSDLHQYMITPDILRYETCMQAFFNDLREIKRVDVLKDKNNLKYLGIPIVDLRYGDLLRSYTDSSVLMINLPSNAIDLSSSEAFANLLKETTQAEDQVLLMLFSNIAAELTKDVKLLNSDNITEYPPLIAMNLQKIPAISAEDNSEADYLYFDMSSTFSHLPNDRVFLSLPSTADIVKSQCTDFEILASIVPEFHTSEFTSSSECAEYVENELRTSLISLVAAPISTFINPWYSVDKIIDGSTFPNSMKSEIKELCKITDNSIYRINNYRVLGIDMEPGSDNYNLLYGKSGFSDEIYENECEYYVALKNLYISVLLAERQCFSVDQLVRKFGRLVRSDWFENFILEQIKVILQEKFSYTGRIGKQVLSVEGLDDDSPDDKDSEDNSTEVEIGEQLYTIIKLPDGSFTFKQPNIDTASEKLRTGELETAAGLSTIAWYLRDIPDPEASITALIQLLRFGERKYQYLKVSDSENDESVKYPYYDLKTLAPCKVLTVERAYETITTSSGKDYAVAGCVKLTKPAYNNMFLNLPTLIVLEKHESNGVTERIRFAVTDLNRFIVDVSNLRSDGTTIITVEGFDFKDGVLEYDSQTLENALKKTFNPVELHNIATSASDTLVIDTRLSSKQLQLIQKYCKEAGVHDIPYENKHTPLAAYAMFEMGQITFVPSEQIKVDPNDPEVSVFKKILQNFLSTLLVTQTRLKDSNTPVTVSSILNFMVDKLKLKAVKPEHTDTVSMFNRILTDTTNYQIVNHVIFKNKDATVGYGFQCQDSHKVNWLLVSGADEIKMRMPINSKGVYHKMDVSKILNLQCIRDFYNATDLNSQIALVAEKHRVVLDTIQTVRKLRDV